MHVRSYSLFLFLPTLSLSFTSSRYVLFQSKRSKGVSWNQFAERNKDNDNDNNNANADDQLSRIEAVRKMLRQEQKEVLEEDSNIERRDLIINLAAGGLLVASGVAASQLYKTTIYTPSGFVRYPQTQFIAALGDPQASEGIIDRPWGLWRQDPGPRGVWLRDFETQLQPSGVAPAGWTFDASEWWLEEHGLIMEKPTFPLPSGRYLVTGGRSVTTGLTVEGNRWKLDEGTLFEVTHLPCRAARYQGGSPSKANPRDFPVRPGATMPSVPDTDKLDYAVLFCSANLRRPRGSSKC